VVYFLRSWKESLAVFLPKNAKLLFLVTLKSLLQSYKTIIIHAGWLLLLSTVLDIIYNTYFDYKSLFVLAPLLSWFITIFAFYLIARPSIKRKGWGYYKDYWRHFIYFVLLSIFFWLIPNVILVLSVWLIQTIARLYSTVFSILILPVVVLPILTSLLIPVSNTILIHVSPLLTFAIFFLLDSKATIRDAGKSLLNAFKMCFYNYPFCLLLFMIFLLFSVALQWLIYTFLGPTSFLLSPLLSTVLLPIPLCFFNTFYVKRLHDQFDLYFPQTVKEH